MFKVRKTVYLTVVATFTAINAVLNAFLVIPLIPGSNIAFLSFAYIPCLIAGAFLGPLAGLTVGFTGDLIGVFIRPVPLGMYNPIIGIANGLLGFIPGFIFREIKLKRLREGKADKFLTPVFKISSLVRNYEDNKPALRLWAADTIRIFISFACTFVICTASLNTFATYVQYSVSPGNPASWGAFWAYFSLRLPWQSLVVGINIVLCIILLPIIKYAFEKVFHPKIKNPLDVADNEKQPDEKQSADKQSNDITAT